MLESDVDGTMHISCVSTVSNESMFYPEATRLTTLSPSVLRVTSDLRAGSFTAFTERRPKLTMDDNNTVFTDSLFSH